MILAFDAKRYFNNATGLGFYSRTLLDGLRQYYPEHRYLLYTPYRKGKLGHREDIAQLPDSAWSRLAHPLWRSSGITRQLRRDKVDIYHGLSHELPAGLRRAGIRSVVTMHDLIFLRYPELYPAVDRYFYQKKYLRAARTADQVVAISGQTRADLITYFNVDAAKIQVIGQSCAAAFEQFSLRAQPDREALSLPDGLAIPATDYLLAVGSLTPRKNWHGLLEALFILQQTGCDLPLVAVGTGKGVYAEGLKAQAKKLGISVYWVNRHCSTTDLALLYRRAAALVYPSVFEGFGIPILEAMTIGIPVVTSTGGCFEEVGGAAALYADPYQPASIAAQIQRSLDTEVRMDLARNRAQQVDLFAPQKICGEWMELYSRLNRG